MERGEVIAMFPVSAEILDHRCEAPISIPADPELLIKAEFERQGIKFLDKPGLYPVTPCYMRSEIIGAFPEITIKQGVS